MDNGCDSESSQWRVQSYWSTCPETLEHHHDRFDGMIHDYSLAAVTAVAGPVRDSRLILTGQWLSMKPSKLKTEIASTLLSHSNEWYIPTTCPQSKFINDKSSPSRRGLTSTSPKVTKSNASSAYINLRKFSIARVLVSIRSINEVRNLLISTVLK